MAGGWTLTVTDSLQSGQTSHSPLQIPFSMLVTIPVSAWKSRTTNTLLSSGSLATYKETPSVPSSAGRDTCDSVPFTLCSCFCHCVHFTVSVSPSLRLSPSPPLSLSPSLRLLSPSPSLPPLPPTVRTPRSSLTPMLAPTPIAITCVPVLRRASASVQVASRSCDLPSVSTMATFGASDRSPCCAVRRSVRMRLRAAAVFVVPPV